MNPIRKLALVVNRQKTGAALLAEKIASLAEGHGVSSRITDTYPVPDQFLAEADACGVLGGDGTLLSVVKGAVAHDVPVFGVNQGKLGFLATFSPEGFCTRLPSILEGNYRIETRSLLCAHDFHGEDLLALNDIVLKNARNSRLVSLRVYCDDEFVTRYHCDGLIFSTPTGSTAYNLSANGPILHTSSEVITMTPICPHTLSNRSVIFSENVSIRIEAEGEVAPDLNFDGRILPASDGFPLHIGISDKRLQLLQPFDYSYFYILRNKLQWGGETD